MCWVSRRRSHIRACLKQAKRRGLSVARVPRVALWVSRWTLALDGHMYIVSKGPRPARNTENDVTMTKIQIELPDATAKAASDAGLLTPQALDRLLTDAIKRRQAADSLLTIADRVAAAGVEPMSMDQVDAEVKAARAGRRQRAGGH
jgi:hypothetical protein